MPPREQTTAEKLWPWACLSVTGVLTLIDLLLGRDENVAGAFSVVPFMISALGTARQTLVVGAVATIVSTALVLYDDVPAASALARTGAVVLASVLALWVAHRRLAREQRIVRLVRVAEIAQRAILAPIPSIIGPFALSAAYRSATDEASVGGDLLDAVETRGGISLIIGDVRGKGIAAVELAAGALRAFRDAALTAPTLRRAVADMDRRVSYQLGEEDFITATLATISASGTLELVNCAHPPALLIRHGERRLLEPRRPTTPFGLDPDPEPLRLQLAPGDRLLLYTDGLIEARDRTGGFIPLEELTARLGDVEFDEALDDVMTRLRTASRGHLADDLGLLLLEFRGTHAGRSVASAHRLAKRRPFVRSG